MNQTFNFEEKIESIKHLLKPPVGNKCLFNDNYILFLCNSEKKINFCLKDLESRFQSRVGPKSAQSWPKSAQSRPRVGPELAQSRPRVSPNSRPKGKLFDIRTSGKNSGWHGWLRH